MTEITVLELSAEDSDTPDEGLEFVVTPPSNGHLALKSAPSRHILNFTQHHIESRQLLFVHSGQLILALLFYKMRKLEKENLAHFLMFVYRSSVGWFSLPGERWCELWPSRNLQHHSAVSGPYPADKPSIRGLPWYVLRYFTVISLTDDYSPSPVLLLPLKVPSHRSPTGTFRLSPMTSKETTLWSSW